MIVSQDVAAVVRAGVGGLVWDLEWGFGGAVGRRGVVGQGRRRRVR